MSHFLRLPNPQPGRKDHRLDPFAVKGLSDAGSSRTLVGALGFEEPLLVALPITEVESLVMAARDAANGRLTYTVKETPVQVYPHFDRVPAGALG